MTKYSKIKKSSFAVLVLSLILVAIMAFGGTYAYFSGSAAIEDLTVGTGTLTLGGTTNVTISESSLVPNQSVGLTVGENGDVSLDGTTVAAVRFYLSEVVITETGSGSAVADNTSRNGGTVDYDHLDVVVTGFVTGATYNDETDKTKWVEIDGKYYYGSYVTSLENILGTTTVSISLDALAGNEWQGLTATFSITIEAEQAEYVGSAGAITAGTAIDVDTVVSLF